MRTVLRVAVLVLSLVAALIAPGHVAVSDAAATASRASSGDHRHAHAKPVVVPRAGYGFADGMTILSLSPRALDRELDAVQLTGARWLRVPVNWQRVEPSRGHFHWTSVDRVVHQARRHGLTVLANISYAPAWSRSRLLTATAPPSHARLFGTFAGQVARHFRHSVTSYEIWNEPNLTQFFGGPLSHGKAPETYTRLLEAAYPAIKHVEPDATVVAAGLAYTAGSRTAITPSAFVSRMYAAGARGSFDALAMHPYVVGDGDGNIAQVFAQVTKVRQLMKQHHDRRRRIWFTELGSSTWTGGRSQSEQAVRTITELGLAALRRYVGPTFLYSIRDSGSDRSDVQQNFGTLLTHDFQPKKLARLLARPAS